MKTLRVGFRLFDEGGDLHGVELSLPGMAPVRGPFEFDLRPHSRVSGVIAAIERGQASLDDLKDVGSQLWAGLLSGEVGRAFEALRPALVAPEVFVQLRLDLPPELQGLPWEALYDEQRGGFLSSRPQVCVVREPPPHLTRPAAPAAPLGRLRALVVIPEGSGLAVDHEWQNLREAVGRVEEAIELQHLGGRVVPDALLEALGRERVDVVHYVGHGWIDDGDHIKIRFNSDADAHGEVALDGQSFAALFEASPVRLAVLNCCLGAFPSRRLCLSGLGPYLMQRGVPAVVAMRYEIPDVEAIRFSKLFYRHLVDPRSAGRVDVAMARARQSLFLNLREAAARAFITPVLHLATGDEPLFALAGAAAPAVAPAAPPREPMAVPADLAEALIEGRLVPVLGPGLLTAAATRAEGCPLDPRRLLFDLAERSAYPRRLPADEEGSLWLSGHLLPMVCQHFVRTRRRFQLIKLLQEAAERSAVPEPLLAIATWKVPGIVCTHFDGLVEDALVEHGKTPRSWSALAGGEDEPGGDLLVIHLRGKPSDPDSLVLTEEENERLYDRLASLPSPLLHLLHGGIGRSLLFLGVSPRDPIVRRLGRQLLGGGSSSNRGPAFFVCRRRDAVEEAYWQPSLEGIEWIEAEAEELVEALSALVASRGMV